MQNAEREAVRTHIGDLIKGGSTDVMAIADYLYERDCITHGKWSELLESPATSMSKMRTLMNLVQISPRPDIFHRFMEALEPVHRNLADRVRETHEGIRQTSALAGAHGYFVSTPAQFSHPVPESGCVSACPSFAEPGDLTQSPSYQERRKMSPQSSLDSLPSPPGQETGVPYRGIPTKPMGPQSLPQPTMGQTVRPSLISQHSLDSILALSAENFEQAQVSVSVKPINPLAPPVQLTPSLVRQQSSDSVFESDCKQSISFAEWNKILFERQQSSSQLDRTYMSNYTATADQETKKKDITFSEWNKVLYFRQNTEESNCSDMYGPSSSMEDNDLGVKQLNSQSCEGLDITPSQNTIGSSTNPRVGQVVSWERPAPAPASYDEVDMRLFEHMRESFCENADHARRLAREHSQQSFEDNLPSSNLPLQSKEAEGDTISPEPSPRAFRKPCRGHRDPHKRSIEPGRRAKNAIVNSRAVVGEGSSSPDACYLTTLTTGTLYALLPPNTLEIKLRKPTSRKYTHRVFEIERITPECGPISRGFLKVGDIVTAINGVDTSHLCSVPDAEQSLEEAEEQIRLRIERAGYFREIQMQVQLRMTPQSESFGFAYCCGSYRPRYPDDEEFYVTRVVPNSVAVDKLEVGDVILTICGQALAGKTYEEAQAITDGLDTKLTLEIIRTEYTSPAV